MSKPSHQRYPSVDPTREPHSISLKVLRLSRPTLSPQTPLTKPTTFAHQNQIPTAHPASLVPPVAETPATTLFSPLLTLPQSFGAAYVGETFSCTLCANNDLPSDSGVGLVSPGGAAVAPAPVKRKQIRSLKIEAEMKTPSNPTAQKIPLYPVEEGEVGEGDLVAGSTVQKLLNFDLREEGNHVLVVSVTYHESTETSGRQRTFRKLYQFMCKSALVVRTKTGPLSSGIKGGARRWILEAQLENSGEEVMVLEKIGLEGEGGLTAEDCNWTVTGDKKPVLRPKEVEQVCFVVREDGPGVAEVGKDGRVVLGGLSIGWRGEMGSRGSLTTGKLSVRSR